MLTLTSGASSIVVAPEYGAGLTGWMLGRTPILRRALPQAAVGGDPQCDGVLSAAAVRQPDRPRPVPLARHRLPARAQFRRPPAHDPRHRLAAAWAVEEVGPRSVTLSLEHRPDASWPFAFSAEIGYSLSETALTVTIQMTNRHTEPAPAGIGLHPHFPKAHDPSLRFKAGGAWENGADSLPSRHGPARGDWLYTKPRAMSLNCVWTTASPTGTGRRIFAAVPPVLRIEASEAFRQLQVFTPSWADFFCVEPVSHMPDALNRPNFAG